MVSYFPPLMAATSSRSARRSHFRLQIVGRHFRRVNQDPLFAFKRLFYAAVEEEGDVSVFFSFGDAQLVLSCFAIHSPKVLASEAGG